MDMKYDAGRCDVAVIGAGHEMCIRDRFLGLDLLATPQASSFASMMWLIPAICLVTSLLMQLVTTKMQPASASQQQQGCMK